MRADQRSSHDLPRKVRELQVLRLRLHRLEPSRLLRDARSAAAFVKARGIVMDSGRSSLPVLTEAIAGRHIRGSWMADREVFRIHRILTRVRKYGVASAPLVLGKGTLLWPSLGPAAERIASDPERRERARNGLPPLARQLLQEVEREGQVRMDRWPAPTQPARAARLLLERELLVASTSIHTEGGYHTSIVIPWRASKFSQRFRRKAGRLAVEQAQHILLQAAVRSAVIAPEQEVRKWFVFGAGPIEAMVEEGTLLRLGAGRRTWLSVEKQGN